MDFINKCTPKNTDFSRITARFSEHLFPILESVASQKPTGFLYSIIVAHSTTDTLLNSVLAIAEFYLCFDLIEYQPRE